MIYDESLHVGIIHIFSHQLSPIILHQPTAYDQYGNLTFGDASLYHYIMSFPYRVIAFFTDNFAIQVVLLRVLNIGMVVVGLVLFSRLFQELKVKQLFTNIGLLLFVLLPIVPLVAATVNYDNMLFPLTALYLLLCVKALKQSKVKWQTAAFVIIVGCFASLVKYTFLPIFAVSLLYLLVAMIRRHGKGYWRLLVISAKQSSMSKVSFLLLILCIFVGLFVFRYGTSVVRYGSPRPDCQLVMAESRCLHNGTTKLNIQSAASSSQRPALSLPNYTFVWLQNMVSVTDATAETGDFPPPLPIMYAATALAVLFGIGGLIYAWRTMPKTSGWYFLLTVMIALGISVYLTDAHNYYLYHAVRAVQPRYFLSIAPIIIVMMVVAWNYILRNARWAKLLNLIILLILFTQGGGFITSVLRSQDSWYWQNSKVISANHAAKSVLSPLVKKGYGKYGL